MGNIIPTVLLVFVNLQHMFSKWGSVGYLPVAAPSLDAQSCNSTWISTERPLCTLAKLPVLKMLLEKYYKFIYPKNTFQYITRRDHSCGRSFQLIRTRDYGLHYFITSQPWSLDRGAIQQIFKNTLFLQRLTMLFYPWLVFKVVN